MEFKIERMKLSDWEQVYKIYQEGIDTKIATFETSCPSSWEIWKEYHMPEYNIIACKKDRILGWAALAPTSNREVYSGVAEVSVYVSEKYRKKGIGIALLIKLIGLSENIGIWTLQASIFPENKSSIELHEKLGFKIVGIREKIGKMDGIWRDVVLMERRSNKVL